VTSSVLEDAGYDFDDLAGESEVTGTGALGDGAPKAAGTSRSAGSTAGTRRPRRTGAGKLAALQKKLSGEMFQAGAMIGLPLPVTGYYVCQESDAFTRAVVELAAHRPEWVEALEHIADIQPGIVVGRTALGIGAALAVDRGRAEPDKKIMVFLGVYSAWKAVNDKRSPEEGDSASSFKPPPVRFTPVSV
jgi:hypothetical protein